MRARAALLYLAASAIVSCLALVSNADSEIIDRIAVTLDRDVITLSQILVDIRLTEFLNQEPLDFSAAQKKRAADRLIEQDILRREMSLSHYPQPRLEDAEPLLKQVQEKFKNAQAYQEALEKYGITAEQVRQHLLWESAIVNFVDYRFRAGLQVSDDDIQDYYRKQVEEWKTKDIHPVPSLEESRDKIVEILEKEQANQAMDLWLGEMRTRLDISYREDALK